MVTQSYTLNLDTGETSLLTLQKFTNSNRTHYRLTIRTDRGYRKTFCHPASIEHILERLYRSDRAGTTETYRN